MRQFQRLKQRFRAGGARALLHRTRGQPSPRRLAPEVQQQAAHLLQTTYAGFNDVHLTEKLQEVHQLRLSRSSVRRIRRALGLPAKHRRRPRQHRTRRTPEAQMGALVQLDGSPFDWLESRGPEMTLHGMVDDASPTVLALAFQPTEDLHGYPTVLHQTCTQYGLPLALYGDRLSLFVRNDRHWTLEEELQGAQEPTHFGRMLQALGIGDLPAGSPQAKGRIERLWRTLQDRLVSELRLRGISTLETANAFLPEFVSDFNRRFAHAPVDPTSAWRRPPRDLDVLLSCRYERTVARDNTVRLGARWIQIPRGSHGRSYAGCRVDLRECLDGRLLVFYQGAQLAAQPAPGPDFILKPRGAPHADRARRLRASRIAAEGGAALSVWRKIALRRRSPSPRGPLSPTPLDLHPRTPGTAPSHAVTPSSQQQGDDIFMEQLT